MAAGLFSQRKLNSIRKLLPELEKASWNSLLEFAPLSFLSKARGIPAYRDWGIYPGIFLWSLSTMGDRYFHKEHLESLREACRMQDSKVPTASKVLCSYNWLELFSLMSLRQKEKKSVYLSLTYDYIQCILWLMLKKGEKQFYPFDAE